MLFSEEWLRHYINPALSSDELCETLTMGGLEVEGRQTDCAGFTGVIVAQVLTCDQHPNADKLHGLYSRYRQGRARTDRLRSSER